MTALLPLILAGCGPKYVVVHSTPGLEVKSLGRLAILPMDVDKGTFPPGRADRDPQVEEDGPGIVTGLLYHKLEHYPQLELLPRDRVEAADGRIRDQEPGLSLADHARRTGEDLKVSVVLAGRVTTFRKRVGDAYGIERPPSVGFELFLIDTSDGSTLWKGTYYETQQSLFSDLTTFPLFVKRRGRWVTATELAEYGVLELLDRSDWAKEK